MGGGAMRTAAKIAGLGASRAVPKVTEQAASIQKVSRPIAGTGSTSAVDESKASATLLSTQNGRVEATAAIQKPTWEIDDWEFAGKEDEEFFESVDPIPRLVFGPAPTFQEAKEATSDLKEALDKIYFSPSLANGGSSIGSEEPLSLEDSVTKSQVTSESLAILPSLPPKHVLNAFALLKESPEVESVVASIASDKGVWEAVMKNEKVKEFYQTCQTNVFTLEPKADAVFAFAGNGYSGSDSVGENSPTGFSGFFNNIKLQVVDFVSSFTDFFYGVFNTSEETGSAGSKESSTDFVDKALGASFIALAILAIMVILFKRP